MPFDFIGTDAFSGAKQARYVPAGGDTRVLFDSDSDGATDITLVLEGTHDLTDGDFLF